jgi:acyl-CoA dehydrogenase
MNDASDVRTMLVDSATRLFADHVDSKMLDAAKRDGWSPALWKIVEDAQLALVSVPEEAGGAGGTLSDLAAVLRIAGNAAAPVPLAGDRYRRLDACRSGPRDSARTSRVRPRARRESRRAQRRR